MGQKLLNPFAGNDIWAFRLAGVHLDGDFAADASVHFGIKGEGFWQKALNGFNLMAEVCPGHAEDLHTATYTVNVGGTYSIWKDHINLIAELNDGKFFSGGIFFKLHLK